MAQLSSARKSAYNVLCHAHERNAYVREVLNSPFGTQQLQGLQESDAAFARKLALGCEAAKGTLDEIIDNYVAKPSKLDTSVREALRISAYELLYLEKPAHVAVSQGVELVRLHTKSAAGLANAVLRKIAQNRETFFESNPEAKYGLPSWIFKRIIEDCTEERAKALSESLLNEPPIYVAALEPCIPAVSAQAQFEAEGLHTVPCGEIPGAFLIQNPERISTCKLFKDNYAVVSDYAAQTVAYIAAPKHSEQMLEVGSGRGTKSLLMMSHANRFASEAHICAVDIHDHKANIASERFELNGMTGVSWYTGDICQEEVWQELPDAFDRILVDAPCTGTGTLRRHPEIVWSLTPNDVDSCAALQVKMLKSVAKHLNSSGSLIYSTCSILRQENEDVIDAFLNSEEGKGFVIDPISERASSEPLRQELQSVSTPEGYMRTYPSKTTCDGHFCAVLTKQPQ